MQEKLTLFSEEDWPTFISRHAHTWPQAQKSKWATILHRTGTSSKVGHEKYVGPTRSASWASHESSQTMVSFQRQRLQLRNFDNLQPLVENTTVHNLNASHKWGIPGSMENYARLITWSHKRQQRSLVMLSKLWIQENTPKKHLSLKRLDYMLKFVKCFGFNGQQNWLSFQEGTYMIVSFKNRIFIVIMNKIFM